MNHNSYLHRAFSNFGLKQKTVLKTKVLPGVSEKLQDAILNIGPFDTRDVELTQNLR